MRKPIYSLTVLTLGILLLSGCFKGFQADKPVQEPPWIPAPPVLDNTSQTNQNPAFYIGTYADVAKLREQGRQPSLNPRLFEAISHAIRIGVLRPTGPLDQFHPDQPLRYQEFRAWVTAYQAAEAGVALPAVNNPEKSTKTESAQETAPKQDDLNSPMSPTKLGLLANQFSLGSHLFADDDLLTREELCALAIFLSRKTDAALALSLDALENMTPQGNAMNQDEALSLFKDYPAISDWAKPYVALAYRDMLLQKAFNLNSNQLTIEDGFQPTRQANRADAIVLLHQLYGHIQTPIPASTFQAKPDPPSQTFTKSGMKGVYQPSGLQLETAPLQRNTPPVEQRQTLEQSGPNGSQRLQRTEGAH